MLIVWKIVGNKVVGVMMSITQHLTIPTMFSIQL